ncbi:transposase InsO family protein [Sinorhizobium meliloti]
MDAIPLHGSASRRSSRHLRRRWASTRFIVASTPRNRHLATRSIPSPVQAGGHQTQSGLGDDLTYIPMARGFVYLCAVVDWFSRRVLSWRLSITMKRSSAWRSRSACSLWQAGDLQHRRGLGVHVRRLVDFTAVLKKRPRSTSRWTVKGAWRDNVFIERLWRSIKYEEVYLHVYKTVSVPHWHQPLSDLLKVPTPHSPPDRQTPDQAYFNTLAPMMAAASSRRKSTLRNAPDWSDKPSHP